MGGTLFFPFLMKEKKSGGYTLFPLLNKGEEEWEGTLFFPFLIKEKKSGGFI